MIPTLLGIMVINFVIVQAAPGGPVEQMLARAAAPAAGDRADHRRRRRRGQRRPPARPAQRRDQPLRGARGLDPALIEQLEQPYGFDKPAMTRFVDMLRRYLRFDFGESFFSGRPVIDLIVEKMPVSISLGLWTTLITYLVSIPLGIRKAVRDGSRFDLWTSAVIVGRQRDPGLPVRRAADRAVRRRQLLADVPAARPRLRAMVGSWPGRHRMLDYLWHMVLPIIALVDRRLRRADHADQELVPRGDRQAVRR